MDEVGGFQMKRLKLILCMTLGLLLFGAVGTQAAGKKPEMDRTKAIATLQVGFDYSDEELGALYDTGISYQELKNTCMHAFIANVPLQEIVDLRKKYGWTRIKFLLGLTPQKFYEGELQYKANRLYKIMGLDKEVALITDAIRFTQVNVITKILICLCAWYLWPIVYIAKIIVYCARPRKNEET